VLSPSPGVGEAFAPCLSPKPSASLRNWNVGIAPFGQINAYGEKREAGKLGEQLFT